MKGLLIIYKSLMWLYFIILSQKKVFSTIDINLNELKYLAARLNPFECRRLITALHYTTYELPNTLAAAERNVDDEIPCIRHLLHWNSSPLEGKSNTHEALAHRLRQINRNDLADWLGRSAFTQLGKDLDRAMAKPFDELVKEVTESSYPITLASVKSYQEEESWLQIDIVLMGILLGLLGTLLTLICAVIATRSTEYFRKIKYKYYYESPLPRRILTQKGIEDENQKTEGSMKYTTESSAEVTDNLYSESKTQTDFT